MAICEFSAAMGLSIKVGMMHHDLKYKSPINWSLPPYTTLHWVRAYGAKPTGYIHHSKMRRRI